MLGWVIRGLDSTEPAFMFIPHYLFPITKREPRNTVSTSIAYKFLMQWSAKQDIFVWLHSESPPIHSQSLSQPAYSSIFIYFTSESSKSFADYSWGGIADFFTYSMYFMYIWTNLELRASYVRNKTSLSENVPGRPLKCLLISCQLYWGKYLTLCSIIETLNKLPGSVGFSLNLFTVVVNVVMSCTTNWSLWPYILKYLLIKTNHHCYSKLMKKPWRWIWTVLDWTALLPWLRTRITMIILGI